MDDKSDKKVKEEPTEDALPLGPTLALAEWNDYLGLHGDATGCRNPRRITNYFKSVSSHPGDVNATVGTYVNTKSDASDTEFERDEVDKEKKPPPTKQRAESQGQNRKDPTVDDVILSDEEETTDNDFTDNDEDYESDKEKKPPIAKRKAKLQGQHRQGATANNQSQKPPPTAAAATAAGNKHRSATTTPIIYLGGYKTASKEYIDYMHFLALHRKGDPWSDRHYEHLRKRFSGHDFVLTKSGQEAKAKKPDIIKSAAQMYKKILKKLSHAQAQVTNKKAGRNDSNPTAATRQRTAPAPAPAAAAAPAAAPAAAVAAAVAQVADATPMDDGTEDIGNVVNTFVAKLRTRKEAAFNSEDDDVCAKGLKIKQFITHVEKGRATHGL
jgi:hypothetical protein